MTEETRAFFRQHLYELVRWAMLPGARVNTAFEVQQQPGNYMTGVVVSMNADVDDDTVPPLTTAQQLALSVLLGEPVPLPVLLSACEDAGVFEQGLLTAIVEKVRQEERNRRWHDELLSVIP